MTSKKGLGYGEISKLMEEYSKHLGNDSKRVSPIEFYSGGLCFFKTNLKDSDKVKVTKDKILTKKLVCSAGIKVPKTYSIEDVRFPAIIKPIDGTGGKGVKKVNKREDIPNSSNLIIEEFIPGLRHRVLVSNDNVFSVLRLHPPSIIGDGVSSIEKLMKEKDKIREGDLSYGNMRAEKGINKKRIPKKEEVVQIHLQARRLYGSDIEEIAGSVSNEFKTFCIESVRAINTFPFLALDVMFDGKELTFLEANSQPHLTQHYYPQGNTEPVLVHKFIIRTYLNGYNL